MGPGLGEGEEAQLEVRRGRCQNGPGIARGETLTTARRRVLCVNVCARMCVRVCACVCVCARACCNEREKTGGCVLLFLCKPFLSLFFPLPLFSDPRQWRAINQKRSTAGCLRVLRIQTRRPDTMLCLPSALSIITSPALLLSNPS